MTPEEVARHATTLERAARRSTAAGTAGVPVHLLHTMRGTLPGKAMTLHHAREAAALAGADHVDRRHVGQDVHLQLLTYLVATD